MEQKQISEFTDQELLTARADFTAQLLQIQLQAINNELGLIQLVILQSTQLH